MELVVASRAKLGGESAEERRKAVLRASGLRAKERSETFKAILKPYLPLRRANE